MNNLITFIKNLVSEAKEELKELHEFTCNDKESRDNNVLPYIIKSNNIYKFIHNGKSYSFKCLSDCNILKEDKTILQDSKERDKYDLAASIKIALAKQLNYQRLILVVQENNNLICIVEYEYKGNKYIINYSLNLIMKKDDYYDLFTPREINILDKPTLFTLMDFYENISEKFELFYILFFGNEILDVLKKQFKSVEKKFDIDGIHNNNGYVFNDPFLNKTYDICVDDMDLDIQDFTLNLNPCDNITYDYERKWYLYNNNIPFRLLSDYLPDSYSSTLKSENRYHLCHRNSRKLLKEIIDSELVSGLIMANDLQYFLHSWIEKDDMVYDFNRNLIMKKEDYYKMLNVKVINRSTKELIDENRRFFRLLRPSSNFILFDNYFSQELNKDFKKHSYIFEKQKDSN